MEAGRARARASFGPRSARLVPVLPATRVDPVVFRSLLRIFHMLDTPESLLRDPLVVLRSLPVLARTLGGDEPEDRFAKVTRDEALRHLRAA